MLPTPDDPKGSPVWENYVVAQAVQAMLGIVPIHALAVGVVVDGATVRVRFQLSEVSDVDVADMADIRAELQDLLGSEVDVSMGHEVLAQRRISPRDGGRWVFLARAGGSRDWEVGGQ